MIDFNGSLTVHLFDSVFSGTTSLVFVEYESDRIVPLILCNHRQNRISTIHCTR